jgi:hypothetical protein
MVFFNNVYWQKIGNCLEVFSNVNSLILWNISPSFWDQRIEKKKMFVSTYVKLTFCIVLTNSKFMNK